MHMQGITNTTGYHNQHKQDKTLLAGIPQSLHSMGLRQAFRSHRVQRNEYKLTRMKSIVTLNATELSTAMPDFEFSCDDIFEPTVVDLDVPPSPFAQVPASPHRYKVAPNEISSSVDYRAMAADPRMAALAKKIVHSPEYIELVGGPAPGTPKRSPLTDCSNIV